MSHITNPVKTSLPPNFTFSQSSLQALVDCPRLFQLRYILQIAWPAPSTEPIKEFEDNLHHGQAFHQLVHQYLLGIPDDRLTKLAKNSPRLSGWWHSFLNDTPDLKSYAKHPEITLSTPLEGSRLVAKFDLLAIHPALAKPSESHPMKAIIYDWKTTKNRPKRAWQENRLQTRVYPFTLLRAAKAFLNLILQPEQIEMKYWFANFPTAPMTFQYNQVQYQSDEQKIRSLITAARDLGSQEAPKTDQVKRCRYCIYRSLCDRGSTAGKLEGDFELDTDTDLEIGSDLALDFDQIAEIEF